MATLFQSGLTLIGVVVILFVPEGVLGALALRRPRPSNAKPATFAPRADVAKQRAKDDAGSPLLVVRDVHKSFAGGAGV